MEKGSIKELIDETDGLIAVPSWKFSQTQADRLITLQNELFDISIKSQEVVDISKLKHENTRGGELIELKDEKDSAGKKKYTDLTAQALLDNKYEENDIDFLTNKFLFKVVENKLRLLNEKLLLVKKYIIQ